MTLRPLRQEGAHESRFIAGQESYVTREISDARDLLGIIQRLVTRLSFVKIFQRVANERLSARITTYLADNLARVYFSV